MKTIYVIDMNDVCCPECYEEITPEELAFNTTELPPWGNLKRHKMNCPSCGVELELRSHLEVRK